METNKTECIKKSGETGTIATGKDEKGSYFTELGRPSSSAVTHVQSKPRTIDRSPKLFVSAP